MIIKIHKNNEYIQEIVFSSCKNNNKHALSLSQNIKKLSKFIVPNENKIPNNKHKPNLQ